tara:strand:+ start:277 stop:492 length:216 start_codon:yes stop_codon:yes gene_type:complete
MQLKSYLRENSLTSQAFADQLSVTRGSIERYKSGDRIPRPHILISIFKLTQGKVTPNDFIAVEGLLERKVG